MGRGAGLPRSAREEADEAKFECGLTHAGEKEQVMQLIHSLEDVGPEPFMEKREVFAHIDIEPPTLKDVGADYALAGLCSENHATHPIHPDELRLVYVRDGAISVPS